MVYWLIEQLLIEVDHVLQNNFLFILKGLTILKLLIIPIKSLPDHHCDIIPYLDPNITIDLSWLSDSLNHLQLNTHLHPSILSLATFISAFSHDGKLKACRPFISYLFSLLLACSVIGVLRCMPFFEIFLLTSSNLSNIKLLKIDLIP